LLAVNGQQVTDGHGMEAIKAATRPITIRLQYSKKEKRVSRIVQKSGRRSLLGEATVRISSAAGKFSSRFNANGRGSARNTSVKSVTSSSKFEKSGAAFSSVAE